LFFAEIMADTTTPSAKAPWHLWAVGVASVIWNSIGVLDFVMTQTRNQAYLSGLTAVQRDFFFSFPLWVVLAWCVAVFGGALASVLLLLRRRQAVHLFLASAVGMVLTDFNSFVLSNGLKVMGGAGSLAFTAVIFVIGVLLLIYARRMRRRGVLC
jgi:hypothetical protein